MRTALTRIAAGGASIGLALITTAVTAQPAAADVLTFQDGGGHLTSVWVRHGAENIRVKAKVGPYEVGSHFTFWFNTDTDDGPEYKIKVYPNSEVVPLQEVESFSDAGATVDCDYRASADAFGSQYVTIVVPRSCVGTPDVVRVSIKARYAVPGPNITDWGPGERRFFGPVES